MNVTPNPRDFNTKDVTLRFRSPYLRKLLGNGEDHDPMAAILPAPKPVAPAALEKELV